MLAPPGVNRREAPATGPVNSIMMHLSPLVLSEVDRSFVNPARHYFGFGHTSRDASRVLDVSVSRATELTSRVSEAADGQSPLICVRDAQR